MNKIKKLFTLLFASSAMTLGIVAGSLVCSNNESTSTIEANATGEEIIIYFYHNSEWDYGQSFDSSMAYEYKYTGGTDKVNYGASSSVTTARSEIIGDDIAKIYLPTTATEIRFKTRNSDTLKYNTPYMSLTDKNNQVFVLDTRYDDWGNTGQGGTWVDYETQFVGGNNPYVQEIFFMVSSGWNKNKTNYVWVQHDAVSYTDRNDHSKTRTDTISRTVPITQIIDYKGIKYSKLLVDRKDTSSNAQIVFKNTSGGGSGSQKTENLTIPGANGSSASNNLYVLESERTDIYTQYGHWMKFADDGFNWSVDSDTLYFVPNYKWSHTKNGTGYTSAPNYCLWPSLTVTFSELDGQTEIHRYPSRVMKEGYDITDTDPVNRQWVYAYDNIPLTSLTSISFNYGWSTGVYVNFTNTSEWFATAGSEHAKNIFGMSDNDWYGSSHDSTAYTDYFHSDGVYSKALMMGTFSMHENIDWTNDGEGYIPFPTKYNYFSKVETDNYTITLNAVRGDTFEIATYYYLDNTSTNGEDDGASWYLNGFTANEADLENDVTIYDNGVKVDDVDISNYLVEDGDAYRFARDGRVTFKRTTNVYTEAAFSLNFSSNTDSNYYVIGEGYFVDGTPAWSISTGVRMKDGVNDNNAIVSTQFFKAGDAFVVKNNSTSTVYGYEQNQSGDTRLGRAVTGNEMYVVNNHKDGYESNNGYFAQSKYDKGQKYAPASSLPIYIQVTDSKWLEANALYGIWCMETNKVYVGTRVSEEDYGEEGVTVRCDLPIDIFENGFTLCRVNAALTEGVAYPNENNNIWNWSVNNCENNAEGTKGKFGYDNNRIYVKQSGYYNIHLDENNELFINPIDAYLKNDAIYLDVTDNTNWPGDYHIYAHFWHDTYGSESTDVELKLVHNHPYTGRIIYEGKIPTLTSADAIKVCFTKGVAPDDTNDRTTNLSFQPGSNMFVLNGSYYDSKAGGAWGNYVTNKDRAEYFGAYFNSLIVCDDGVNQPNVDNWNIAGNEFDNMCNNVQTIVKKTEFVPEPLSTDTELTKAMSKYDYIIWKYNRTEEVYADFADRTASDSGSSLIRNYSAINNKFNLFGIEDNNLSVVIIIMASSIALLSITGLSVLMIRKHKTKEITNFY